MRQGNTDRWSVLVVLERRWAMRELQVGGCPKVFDALTYPACPNMSSQEDAVGLCSSSSYSQGSF